MKNIRGFALGVALGLAAALSTVGLAQNSTPKDQKPQTESCCAMESCCCCKGDSCSTKHDAKNHSSHEGCCSGDSCNLKMKDKQKQG